MTARTTAAKTRSQKVTKANRAKIHAEISSDQTRTEGKPMIGTQTGIQVVHDLVTAAQQRPEVVDLSPGGLGHLLASVQYALSGQPIREGSPHTLASRVHRLQLWMDEHAIES